VGLREAARLEADDGHEQRRAEQERVEARELDI
jgi:hypothetical protein